MEACLTRCSHGTSTTFTLLRTLNLFNPTLQNSIRCSSTSPTQTTAKKAYDALLLDAGGTLLQLAKPVAETYATIGKNYGLTGTTDEIKIGFKRAFAAPWPKKLRYEGDGRPFWKLVVSEATGCANEDYFEEVYDVSNEVLLLIHLEFLVGIWMYLRKPLIIASVSTFHMVMLGISLMELIQQYVILKMLEVILVKYFLLGRTIMLKMWKNLVILDNFLYVLISLTWVVGAVKMAVVSNFDTRLRKLLKDLNVLDLFDAVIISSEVGYEKPDAKIFKAALDQINVDAHKAVHVGDDEKADKAGANAVGIDCWLWGTDVKTFSDIQNHIFISDP